jgi:hypothetical protein
MTTESGWGTIDCGPDSVVNSMTRKPYSSSEGVQMQWTIGCASVPTGTIYESTCEYVPTIHYGGSFYGHACPWNKGATKMILRQNMSSSGNFDTPSWSMECCAGKFTLATPTVITMNHGETTSSYGVLHRNENGMASSGMMYFISSVFLCTTSQPTFVPPTLTPQTYAPRTSVSMPKTFTPPSSKTSSDKSSDAYLYVMIVSIVVLLLIICACTISDIYMCNRKSQDISTTMQHHQIPLVMSEECRNVDNTNITNVV